MSKLGPNKVLRFVLKLHIVATLAFLLFFPLFKSKQPPTALSVTVHRMTALIREAVEFRSKRGRNVRSTGELLTFSPHEPTNRIVDGWGNEFKIEVASDGGIKIFSNGEDNQPGGAGDGGTFLPP
jgi:hypothetical protein